MAKDLEDRVRSLESKVLLATGAAVVLAVWVGVTNFYTIPKTIDDSLKSNAAKEALEKINGLVQSAQKSSDQIAQIEKSGASIQIGGVCFRPRVIFRCTVG